MNKVPNRSNIELFGTIFYTGILFVVAGLISLDSGFSGLILLCLGICAGGLFLYFQYGFASGWRNFLENGNSTALVAHFSLAALCAAIFIPAELWGIDATGSFAPISISLFIGSFIFGIGMQLANGCGSGVLFSFGAGSGRMMIALPFFIVGSVIGSLILPWALSVGSYDQYIIGKDLSTGWRAIFNIMLLGLAASSFYIWGKVRGQTISKGLITGTLIIALLCVSIFILSGHPWGITFGFTLWGAKLFNSLGIPISEFTFWTWSGPGKALKESVLANTSSVMDVGMIIGAGIVASVSGQLKKTFWPARGQLFAAAIGGLIMGIGARLAFGCNIGAFLAGTASGSLHGWIWFVMAISGSWIGIKMRPYFGFKNG